LTVIAEPTLHRLANGVRVVCDPLPGFETLALSVVIGRGARYESEPQSGWAHLLEHMVFKTTKSGRELFKELTVVVDVVFEVAVLYEYELPARDVEAASYGVAFAAGFVFKYNRNSMFPTILFSFKPCTIS